MPGGGLGGPPFACRILTSPNARWLTCKLPVDQDAAAAGNSGAAQSVTLIEKSHQALLNIEHGISIVVR